MRPCPTDRSRLKRGSGRPCGFRGDPFAGSRGDAPERGLRMRGRGGCGVVVRERATDGVARTRRHGLLPLRFSLIRGFVLCL
jgi:hypothetical protein